MSRQAKIFSLFNKFPALIVCALSTALATNAGADDARAGVKRFTLMPESLKSPFQNSISIETAIGNQNLVQNGAGVAAGDFDGDGWCDLYFCRLEGPNALFRNRGDWTFEDAAQVAGVACADQYSTGAVFADVNGDGPLDLIVSSNSGGNRVFINRGDGTFENRLLPKGVVTRTGSTTLALADIDGDADLDLYIANYAETAILRGGEKVRYKLEDGKPVAIGRHRNRIAFVDGKMRELGEPDVLYLNDGRGHFEPVSWIDGFFLNEQGDPLTNALWEMGLTAMFRDVDQDGDADLYVCNDFDEPDRFWINQGSGRFQLVDRYALRHTSRFSMSVDFADVNRDGLDDFFVADMPSRIHQLRMTQLSGNPESPEDPENISERPQVRQNTLMLNQGDGTYAEIARYAGVPNSDWTWNSAFLDVDLDGYEDLLIANGNAYDTQDQDAIDQNKMLETRPRAEQRMSLLNYPVLAVPNYAFRNQGNLRFEEVGTDWGFDSKRISHGMALADLDNDGDLDVVLNCLNAPPLLYRNNSREPRVGVRLRSASKNTKGVGARLQVSGGPVPQSQQMIAGGRYLSGDDLMRTFAAASDTKPLSAVVHWPSGKMSRHENLEANKTHLLEEPQDSGGRRQETPATKALKEYDRWFEDVSTSLNLTHLENSENEFAAHPLLPRKLNRPGPGTCWFDINQDGLLDVVLGAAQGQAIQTALQTSDHTFRLAEANAGLPRMPADSLGPRCLLDPGGRTLLLTGFAIETGLGSLRTFLEIYRYESRSAHWQKLQRISLTDFKGGPMELADCDGDGDLDWIVAGQSSSGAYPGPAPLYILENRRGEFSESAESTQRMDGVGYANGLACSDLDMDGSPEIVVACEWDAIKVLKRVNGKYADRTEAFGLAEYSGWWNSVAAGDFNADGLPDLAAGNWGLNHRAGAGGSTILHLYAGDYDGDRSVDLLEGYQNSPSGELYPSRNLLVLGKGIPKLGAMYPTHEAFGKATLPEILEQSNGSFQHFEANVFESMVFLNRGGRFEAKPLPPQTQWSPAFDVSVADFNGDGKEDLFLCQNFFGTRPDETRQDAGKGLILLGQGDGTFEPIPSEQCGIVIYGPQRSSSAADYDQDGRIDLLVSQNNAEVRLFRNLVR